MSIPSWPSTPYTIAILLAGSLIVTWAILRRSRGPGRGRYSWKAVVEQMSDGVLVADPAGRIVAANAAATEIFEQTGRPLVGRTVRELLPAGEPPDGRDMKMPGTERIYSLRRSRLSTRGRRGSRILVLRDITRRVREERELEERSSLAEEANRAKSEFLANMNHELRTPLNHIIGFAELLAGGEAGGLTGRQAEYLQDVLDSARGLLELINDIMEITRIDTGMTALNLEPAGIARILEGTAALLREKAIKHGITLRCEAGGLPEDALLDVRKLRQALYTVMSKALALAPDGGTVEVRGRLLTGEPSRPLVELRVACLDAELPREQLEGIFDPFERVQSGTDRIDTVRGGGLTLAKRLVELQGGRIRAGRTDSHRGTAFTIELPYSAAT